jgi:hypothetical protein
MTYVVFGSYVGTALAVILIFVRMVTNLVEKFKVYLVEK